MIAPFGPSISGLKGNMASTRHSNSERRKLELLRSIKLCEIQKLKLRHSVKELQERFLDGSIGLAEYDVTLHAVLKGGTLEASLASYDLSIANDKRRLEAEETTKEAPRDKTPRRMLPLVALVILLTLLGISIAILRPWEKQQLTGLSVADMIEAPAGDTLAHQTPSGIPLSETAAEGGTAAPASAANATTKIG